MFKRCLLIPAIVLASIYCAVVSCKKTSSDVSMYYLDTINIAGLNISQYDSIWPEYSNIEIKKGNIYLKEPLKLSPDSLHTKLYIAVNGEYKKIPLNIRCWKNDVYRLKEVNKTNNFFNRVERYYYNHFRDKSEFKRHFFNPVLLSGKNINYFVSDGILKKIDGANETELSSVTLQDPMYNQMIVDGAFGIIRSGNKIIFSDDSLSSWSEIYAGPRQIKESMFWNNQDSTLLFSQYTPGKVRNRHYILKYDYIKNNIDTVFTFYTEKEFLEKGLSPCARHIHVLTVDPYTGWIFIGTGDTDNESAIYVSENKGTSFLKIGGGAQVWRTLSFIFTKNYIYWNTDSDAPQYLSRVPRKALDKLPVNPDSIIRYPLFNSALWNTIQYGDITLMTSNVEGALYDRNRRIYGIKFNKSGDPVVYNLWEEKGDTWSSQLFPIGIDKDGLFQFYDTQNMKYRYFMLQDKNGNRL